MVVVNRRDFIAWTEGILLERDAMGTCRIGDREIHEKAKQALDRGETIALTEQGNIVSYMQLVVDEYLEFEGNQSW